MHVSFINFNITRENSHVNKLFVCVKERVWMVTIAYMQASRPRFKIENHCFKSEANWNACQ